VCYEVDDLRESLAHARTQRCVVISDPVEAVAFQGRRIAWLFTPTRQLTELLERAA
jgi:methylmalonyl-CoA/ethylmalonyl-CoA epimerase